MEHGSESNKPLLDESQRRMNKTRSHSFLRREFMGKLPDKVTCGIVDPEKPSNIALSKSKGLTEGKISHC